MARIWSAVALVTQIAGDLANDVLVAGLFEIGLDRFGRIGAGLVAGFAHQLGRPEAQQLISARLGLEGHLGIMGELVFKRVFAVVEGGDGVAPSKNWFVPDMPIAGQARKGARAVCGNRAP